MEGTGQLERCATEDWCAQTIASWRQSIWVGVEDPWYVIFKFNPFIWWKVVREIVTLERMHRAFESGLMEYGARLVPQAVSLRAVCCAGAWLSDIAFACALPSQLADHAQTCVARVHCAMRWPKGTRFPCIRHVCQWCCRHDEGGEASDAHSQPWRRLPPGPCSQQIIAARGGAAFDLACL